MASIAKPLTTWLPLALGIVWLLFFAMLQGDRIVKGRNDFVSFYVGGHLAGSPDLYSRQANIDSIRDTIGVYMEGTTFVRPPYYAALMKPFSWLPYRTAYVLFLLTTFASVLWFVIRFARECPPLPYFAAFGIPLLTPLCNGQDTPYLLAIVGAALLLLRARRDFAAGLVLALCAMKFHLFLFVALLLLMKRRWTVIQGGAAGTVVLTVLGLAVAGPDSIARWIATMRDPWIQPGPELLPNIHGLVLTFGGALAWELALAAAVGITFLYLAFHTERFEMLFAMALVCGLLTSFHSGPADDILLFPAFVMILASTDDKLLRSLAALVLTPVVYLVAFAGTPYSILMPVLLLVLLGATAARVRKAEIPAISPVVT